MPYAGIADKPQATGRGMGGKKSGGLWGTGGKWDKPAGMASRLKTNQGGGGGRPGIGPPMPPEQSGGRNIGPPMPPQTAGGGRGGPMPPQQGGGGGGFTEPSFISGVGSRGVPGGLPMGPPMPPQVGDMTSLYGVPAQLIQGQGGMGGPMPPQMGGGQGMFPGMQGGPPQWSSALDGLISLSVWLSEGSATAQ